MAAGLFSGSTAACVSTPPPPLPPAPPGGYQPPPPQPPSPPSPPPQAPRELLSSESVALCIPGLAQVETYSYESELIEGVAAYLTLVRTKVRMVSVEVGCNSSATGRRRLLVGNSTYVNATVLGNITVANSTANFALDDVPASVLATKLQPLYNASTASTTLAVLSTSINSALAAAGLPPLQAQVLTTGTLVTVPLAPPPPRPPPRPPGTTPASLLAAANAEKKSSRGPRLRDVEAAQVVAYAIAALVVLWLPVHAAVHAVQAAYLRRTAVTAALAIRLVPSSDGQDKNRRLAVTQLAASAEENTGADGEDKELVGRRFGAPKLAAALIDTLACEAAAAAAADVEPPPRRPALRPLLRTPLVTALGAKAAKSTGSQRLAARKKPDNLFWRLKRWLASELHWQARELRHALRALRRCCGGSRDAVGKAFRAVPAPGGASAVLVEVTWRFGWKGRNSAACWRRRLRDGAQLAALEAAIAGALAGSQMEVAVQAQPGADADQPPVVLALLDDEPHANLDKKLKAKRNTSVADGAAPVAGEDGRSAGVAPAVAARLEAVLHLCAKRCSDEPAAAAMATPMHV